MRHKAVLEAVGAPAFWLHLCRRTKVEEKNYLQSHSPATANSTFDYTKLLPQILVLVFDVLFIRHSVVNDAIRTVQIIPKL